MIIRTIFVSYITWIVICTNSVLAAEKTDKVPTKQSEAEKIYTDNCAICHGDKGDGDTRAQNGLNPPPRDFTTVQAAMELTRDRMIQSVTNGRPGTGMMPHRDRLSATQISAVVDYIRTRFMNTPVANGPAPVANPKGAKIYTKFCSVCHGDKGNSAVWARSQLNPPPRDFTSAQAAKELTRERMIHSVTNGRPGTGMMSFTTKLKSDEIEAVVDYIQGQFIGKTPQTSLSMAPQTVPGGNPHQRADPHQAIPQRANPHQRTNPHQRANPHQASPHQANTPMAGPQSLPQAIPADMSLPMPNGLQGNVKNGRRFFMKNCFTCHGVKGDGNGPRAYFNTPRPRDFTSSASQRMLNRVRLFNSITHGRVGTVMPAWGKVLNQQQIADVTEFVFQAFIQTSGKKKAQ
ncbi:MAG: c-type cytochrome [Gammaproteobacteria bacterium]|nr:c-type cytochrome [Gammaproteobacteria bacterium]MDH5800848.1 c-type cytochrome [Gammaproteobacteria bacterium]